MEKSYNEKNEGLRQFWQSHIDQWSKTDLSQIEYCRQNKPDIDWESFTRLDEEDRLLLVGVTTD